PDRIPCRQICEDGLITNYRRSCSEWNPVWISVPRKDGTSFAAPSNHVTRQTKPAFADNIALDICCPASDRIPQTAHDLVHPFFRSARTAWPSPSCSSRFDAHIFTHEFLRQKCNFMPCFGEQQLHHKLHPARVFACGGT